MSKALVPRASRVPISFVGTLVSPATVARVPLPLASAEKHRTLLVAASHCYRGAAPLNVMV